jgi:hypothetical protein
MGGKWPAPFPWIAGFLALSFFFFNTTKTGIFVSPLFFYFFFFFSSCPSSVRVELRLPCVAGRGMDGMLMVVVVLVVDKRGMATISIALLRQARVNRRRGSVARWQTKASSNASSRMQVVRGVVVCGWIGRRSESWMRERERASVAGAGMWDRKEAVSGTISTKS